MNMEYIKASDLSASVLSRQPTGIPIIICLFSSRTMRLFQEAGYIEMSLNEELSAALLTYSPKERCEKVAYEFQRIILSDSSPILLTDYEMLFDPRYKLDALKMFCEVARMKNIAVKWCGKSAIEKLEYAEPQYPDYQSFNLARYTVNCVE
jgi:hypothetical protein